MRLCHIVPSLEQRHGGPSKSVKALCQGLVGEGDYVRLLSTDPTAEAESNDGGLVISVYKRGSPQALCPSSGLRRSLSEERVEVIHHHGLWLRTLHYAHRKARHSGLRFVVSPRGMMSSWAWNHHRLQKAFAAAFVHPGAFEAVHGWHATSSAEADDIRSLGFKQPICVAENGTEPMSASDVDQAREFWNGAVPQAASRPVALFYSRFHEKKRVMELIAAWKRVAPKEWILLLVGIPEQYSVAELSAHAAAQGLSDQVLVFSGVGRPPPYPLASLFLLPSHNENFGLSIAEALVNAVPVVVTDTTPWSQVNTLGAGWCVPWAQYEAALKEALCSGAEALGTRGAIAKQWARETFSWSRSAARLRAFYQTLSPKWQT